MPLRIAIVFDTPYPASWGHDEHLRQMDDEIAGRINVPEPEVEYQVADALRQNGHEINLVGLRTEHASLVAVVSERGDRLDKARGEHEDVLTRRDHLLRLSKALVELAAR